MRVLYSHIYSGHMLQIYRYVCMVLSQKKRSEVCDIAYLGLHIVNWSNFRFYDRDKDQTPYFQLYMYITV